MKKQYYVEKATVVNAGARSVYKVLLALERWNQWTPSIRGISILNNDPIRVGARLKVLQPKLSPAVWTVTELDEGRSLTWKKKSPGLTMISEHLITSDVHETRVTIRMVYDGLLGGLAYRLTHSLTDRYMTMEIEGLKKECEKG